jgi:hypothetical protein
MLSLFDRRVTIEAGRINSPGVKIKNLRVVFSVKKTSTVTFNSAKVEIYNMSSRSRDLISNLDLDKPENLLIVKAGYSQQQQSVLFIGNIALTNVKVQRPNVVTTIEANDGEKVFNQLKVPCSGFVGSYQGGIDAKKILKDLVSASGLELKHINWGSIASRVYTNGFCFVGSGKVLLNNLCDYLGVEYSIQNNQLKLFPSGGSDGAHIISLNSRTGLIGSPERLNDVNLDSFTMNTKTNKKIKKHTAGWKVNALLQPMVEPGSVVEVQSEEIKTPTRFRVVEVTHSGDTHGNDWTSSMNVEAV